MKRKILAALMTCLMAVGLVSTADARPGHHQTVVFISGYRSCGTPIYTEKRFCGYNRWGQPIWSYRVISHGEYRGYRPAHPRYPRGHGYYYAHRYQGCGPERGNRGSRITIHGGIRL